MKKGKGLKRTVVGLLATIMATTPLTGCGTPKDDRTITMDVAASATAEVGSEYTVPTAFAFDGTTDYAATVSVKNGNDDIALTNNKFVVKLMTDYTITYYADCGNGKDITKTTTLKVKDETDPTISVGTIAKGKVGEKYTLDYVVSDNSGSANVEFTVKFEDGSDVTVADGGFTPDKVGNYTVTIKATDSKGNSATETVVVTVGETFTSAIAEDLELDFFATMPGTAEEISGTAGETEGIREGNKTLKVTLAADTQMWTSYVIDRELAESLIKVYDAISFDVFIPNAQYMHTIGNGADWNDSRVVVSPDEWTTITLTRNAIRNFNATDPDEDQPRVIGNGSTEEGGYGSENFSIYFDNVRGVMNNETVVMGNTLDFSERYAAITESFADSEIVDFNVVDGSGNAVTSGVNSAAYTFAPASAGSYTVYATLRKANYRDLKLAIAVSAELGNMMPVATDLETSTVDYGSAPIEIIEGVAGTTTGIREGSKAVKFVVTTGDQWPTYTLNPNVVKKLVTIYDAVKVDVYTDAVNAHQIGNGKDWNDSMVTIEPRTWTTVTYTKDAIANYNGTGQSRAIYNDSGNENITFYFDNLRGVIYTDNVIVGETKDFSEKINAIKSTLGADSVSLAVKKNGTAVSGVSELTFSATETGKYTAEATFTKENYNDYTVSIDFEVTKATMYPSGESKDGDSITDVFKQVNHQAKLSVNHDKAFVCEGDASIKWAIESTDYGYCSYTLNTESDYVQNLIANYDAVCFDVYVNGNKAKQVAVGTSWADQCINIQPKVWTTVTITKESLLAYGQNRLLNNGDSYNEICDVYFDNLRGVKYYNDEADAGSPFDYSERLNALKTSLGADSVSLAVEMDGVAVSEGISGLTFTPNDGGNYTVKATFVKANYNDYVVSYDLSVIAADADKECEAGVFMQADEQAKISVNTDRTFVREGRKSIRYTIDSYDSGYCSYILNGDNDYVKSLLETYNAVSFDVYIDGNKSKSLSVGSDWNTTCVEVQPKVWTTITITKEDLLANGGTRLLNNGGDRNELFNIYFDNLRGVNV